MRIMKKLDINFEQTTDTTGYLFSLAKCLSAVLKHSEYKDFADDIIASSGFAFRMWVAPDLCPSATSIWDFSKQPEWVANGGLVCDYTWQTLSSLRFLICVERNGVKMQRELRHMICCANLFLNNIHWMWRGNLNITLAPMLH